MEGGAGERVGWVATLRAGGPGERSAFHLFSSAFIPSENGTSRSAPSASSSPQGRGWRGWLGWNRVGWRVECVAGRVE